MVLSGFASFWTERLWFQSVDYGSVFTTLLLTRVGLFFVFAGLMAATVAVTMARPTGSGRCSGRGCPACPTTAWTATASCSPPA